MGSRNGVLLTGANAKIIVNGITLAYATDISYNIAVKHVNPKVLGMYETQELVPLAYDVTGSFTLIRYVKDAINTAGGGPNNAVNSGDGIGNWTKASGVAAAVGVPFGAGSDEGFANKSFVPRALNTGHHFDIEIRQLVPQVQDGTGVPNVLSVDFLEGLVAGAVNGFSGQTTLPPGQCGVVKLRNCRITNASFSMSKKTAARQTFQFMARYADEDSFTADKSGIGQDLES